MKYQGVKIIIITIVIIITRNVAIVMHCNLRLAMSHQSFSILTMTLVLYQISVKLNNLQFTAGFSIAS